MDEGTTLVLIGSTTGSDETILFVLLMQSRGCCQN